MEPSPDTLVSIAAGVDDPRLGLCLDVGHANTCVSTTPPAAWVAPMAPYLRHVHLHSNEGDTDLHGTLGTGTVPMGDVIDAVLRAAGAARRVPFGVEVALGYLAAKEAEWTAVRTVLSGRMAGVPAEALRERLREQYV